MSLGFRLVVGASCVLFVLGLTTPAGAVPGRPAATDPVATTLTLAGRAAYADTDTTLTVTLVDADGAPVPDAPVAVDRRAADEWRPVGQVTTDQSGTASLPATMARRARENEFRASYAGDATHAPSADQARVPLKRRGSRVRVGGPTSVVDEKSVPVRVRWTTGTGQAVPGTVRLYRSLAGGRWTLVRTLHTGPDGRAMLVATPRQDSRWRAHAVRQDWVEGDLSPVHRIDNLPPGRPVALPKAAPRPRITLPPQPHAVGAGPNLVVRRIPGRVWAQMTGISWHRGCPVGRAGLRLVRVNYWDFAGYRRRGELVASTAAAPAMGAALAAMYRHELPIRAMYRVDRFGWGKRSQGGNDYRSMAADNTSAFNCRWVTGRPGVRSPHSYGGSIDINPWENPYRSAHGLVPDRWWMPRSDPRVAWRSRSHVVVQIMARHGLRWTYGLGDTQHFDYVGGAGRAEARPVRCDRYCD